MCRRPCPVWSRISLLTTNESTPLAASSTISSWAVSARRVLARSDPACSPSKNRSPDWRGLRRSLSAENGCVTRSMAWSKTRPIDMVRPRERDGSHARLSARSSQRSRSSHRPHRARRSGSLQHRRPGGPYRRGRRAEAPLPAAHPSMHSYCVHELHLSEDSALKRIRAARAARRFPALFGALSEGRLSLSAIVLLKPHLTRENAGELVEAAAFKTRAEIELLLAQRFPRSETLPMVHGVLDHQHPPTTRWPRGHSKPEPSGARRVTGHSSTPPAQGPAAPVPPRSRVVPLSAKSFERTSRSNGARMTSSVRAGSGQPCDPRG
jgi:hypothetical protein